MASTTTTRLALVKPTAGTAEPVNVTTQLDDNWDKVDSVVGLTVVTSSTRPSSPWQGQTIFETNTGRAYLHNGSSPASAGWKQILADGGTYGQTIDIERSSSGSHCLRTKVTGDTVERFLVIGSGLHEWGAGGSSARDTNLYRDSANVLKTDDSLIVGTDLTINGNFNPAYRVKVTSDQTNANNNTTFFNVTELVKAMAANTTYRLHLFMRYSSTTVADFKMQLTGPSGADLSPWWFWGTSASLTDTSGRCAAGAVVGLGGNGAATTTSLVLKGEGFIVNGANAGNLQVQVAKNTAEASTLTIYKGSFLILEPVS